MLFEVGFGGMITIPAAFVFLGATTLMVNQNGQEVAMNAFEAAEQTGKAEEPHSQLLDLAKAQNKSANGGTSIPATFLRVTVTV